MSSETTAAINLTDSPTKTFLRKICQTSDSYIPLVLRITLGLVMFPHGAQKVFGWFGGYGFSGTMGFFTEQLGIPWIFAFLAIAAEFAGSIGLIVGLGSRVAAFGIGVTMAVAVYMNHLGHGFFMNWYGTQKGEGFEYHLLVIGISLAIIISGGGARSLDRNLSK